MSGAVAEEWSSRLVRRGLLLLATAVWSVLSPVCGQPTSNSPPVSARGSELAHTVCAACHLFPEPDLLDKKTWREQTLPRMQIRLGLSPQSIERHKDSALLKATGLFPESPMLPAADFQEIVNFYTASAPENALPQAHHEEIKVGLPHFKLERSEFRLENPATTLLQFSEKTRRIYVGDAQQKALFILEPNGRLVEKLPVNNIPVSLKETDQGFWLTSIGHFIPSEEPLASLVRWSRKDDTFVPELPLLEKIPRTTYTEFADLNGDGKQDIVVCMFGNMTGRLSWFENLGGDKYTEHVIYPKAGALRVEIRDFNGDGFPDLAVLFAQESETLFIFTNNGKGEFKPEPVFQKHPLYGHTYFEMADFNGDGKLDLLVTNGDNGEYASPLKRYHGVRIYLNNGSNHFAEAFFYPLDGAFKAMARDFDGDGDLDIAAISFFPDYKDNPRESFVYLQNQGGLKFTASTFRECISGRWLTMDVADVDGDGKLDILLGSCIHGPSDVPDFLMNIWEKGRVPYVLLKNTLK